MLGSPKGRRTNFYHPLSYWLLIIIYFIGDIKCDNKYTDSFRFIIIKNIRLWNEKNIITKKKDV